MMKRLSVLVAVLSLAACVQHTLVPPGKASLSDRVQTETPIAWSQQGSGDELSWTVDGMEGIHTLMGLESGKPLASAVKDAGKFVASMTEVEVMDLYTDTASRLINRPMTASNLAPATVGGKPGFRFDISYSDANDVRYKGFVVAAVVDGKLYLLRYTGTELHHFAKYQPAAESVVANMKIK